MANNLNGKLKVSNIDCFNIGSTVSCRTCHHKDIEGEVMAFDSSTKILILKCPANDGRTTVNDINFVNLNFVSDVQVIKEVTSAPPTPHSLSINMLKNRLKNNVDSKRRLITSLQAGVSPEGQKLYLTISKTITDLKWDGPDILVYDNVRIKPPYKPENLEGIGNNKGIAHIRKLVEKFTEEAQSAKREAQTSNNNNNNSTNTTNNNNNHNHNHNVSSNVSVSNSSNGSGNHSNCATTVPQ